MSKKPRLLKTKKDKEEFVFWIETLKAAVIPQSEFRLEDLEGCCCLGVGVLCTVPESKMRYKYGPFIDGSLPTSQPAAPHWLKRIDRHAEACYDFSPSENNDCGMPHPQIAAKLWEFYKWELE